MKKKEERKASFFFPVCFSAASCISLCPLFFSFACDNYSFLEGTGGVRLVSFCVKKRGKREAGERDRGERESAGGRGRRTKKKKKLVATLARRSPPTLFTLSLPPNRLYVPRSLPPPQKPASPLKMASSMLRPMPTMRTVTPARRGAVQVRHQRAGGVCISKFQRPSNFFLVARGKAKESQDARGRESRLLFAFLLLGSRSPPSFCAPPLVLRALA